MRSKAPEAQAIMFPAESNPKIQSQEAAFQDERRSGIGGSDVGALYNLDMGCRRRLFYDKTGQPVDFKKEETPEMERGIIMEHVCRMIYEKRTGRKVKLMPLARHSDFLQMIVHVDGETEAPNKEGPGYAEFKVVNRFVMQKFLKSGVRDSYILQLQHGMVVKDYRWGSFGILCLDPWRFEWFDVDEDRELQTKLIFDEQQAWMEIKSGTVPDPLEKITDSRCAKCAYRRTCRGQELSAAVPTDDKGEIVSRPDLSPLVQECVELGELKDQATELAEDARKALKTAIGEAYGLTVPGYRCLYPTSFPERWDGPALKQIESEAKRLLATEPDMWDLESLENRCTELLQVVIGITRARKAAKPERSLRIYPTGD